MLSVNHFHIYLDSEFCTWTRRLCQPAKKQQGFYTLLLIAPKKTDLPLAISLFLLFKYNFPAVKGMLIQQFFKDLPFYALIVAA